MNFQVTCRKCGITQNTTFEHAPRQCCTQPSFYLTGMPDSEFHNPMAPPPIPLEAAAPAFNKLLQSLCDDAPTTTVAETTAKVSDMPRMGDEERVPDVRTPPVASPLALRKLFEERATRFK